MSEHQQAQSPQDSPRNRPRVKTQTTPKIDYRGITLKQYFRLTDNKSIDQSIKQIQQQSTYSSRNSLIQTPTFGDHSRKEQNKTKTQANQQQSQKYCKNNNKNNNCTFDQIRKLQKLKQNTSSIQKLNTSLMKKICVKKNEKQKQKLKTLGAQQLNRSTLNGFYKIKAINSNNHLQKKNKMLNKIKADRQRSQQIKQQDIFYITKYANKFNIDTKKLLQ